MKTKSASRVDFLTISAPWTSMSRTHTCPLVATASTAAKEVP